jgi:hypothetical protein
MAEEQFALSEELRIATEAKVNASKAGKYENPTVLSDVEAASSEAYRIVKPLIEMKQRQIVKEQELQIHLDSLMSGIEANTRELNSVKDELASLVKLRSVNAEKESKALDKLLEVL